MPTKRLPPSADIAHLKYQAKDLLSDVRSGAMSAYQRIREFHPRCHDLADKVLSKRTFTLGDAQMSIAREYGFPSWPALKRAVGENHGLTIELTHNERISDPIFRQAVDLLDEGDVDALARHLQAHPGLVHRRVEFLGDNYFTNPTLLEFVAENPVRLDRLPDNIVDVTRVILNAGARGNIEAVDATLGLVASGRVAREAGVQVPLIDLLCDFGARPDTALRAALAHQETKAATHLIARGAQVDLPAAAALGDVETANELAKTASEEDMQLALAMAALSGQHEMVPILIRAGADPNRYNPKGANSHCTALHSAAVAGHVQTVEALVEAGARTDIRDIHHDATAAQWADHAGHAAIASYLARS